MPGLFYIDVLFSMCNSADWIFIFIENYSLMRKVTFWMKRLKILWRCNAEKNFRFT